MHAFVTDDLSSSWWWVLLTKYICTNTATIHPRQRAGNWSSHLNQFPKRPLSTHVMTVLFNFIICNHNWALTGTIAAWEIWTRYQTVCSVNMRQQNRWSLFLWWAGPIWLLSNVFNMGRRRASMKRIILSLQIFTCHILTLLYAFIIFNLPLLPIKYVWCRLRNSFTNSDIAIIHCLLE